MISVGRRKKSTKSGNSITVHFFKFQQTRSRNFLGLIKKYLLPTAPKNYSQPNSFKYIAAAVNTVIRSH